MNSPHLLQRARAWFGCRSLALLAHAVLAAALLALGSGAARAQEDPPGRVGRLAGLHGGVSWYDHEQGSWAEAEHNRPLTGGDRLSTSPQGRAELRVGSTVLRLAAGTELEVLHLDDERMSFQLHAGSLALRVRAREVAREIDITTAEVRLRPERAGHYRIDRVDDTTQAGVWRGTLRIDDAEGFIIETGQRAELWREGRQRGGLRFAWSTLPSDAFSEQVARDDKGDERSASTRYVSPEMTGAEDLDRNGRWDRHPEYGAIWFPLEVRADWAPYRYGHWAWVRPWGWTWVDDARWGFAPFHYGRWVSWGGRWGWAPGDYVARPVYAPALVAWIGGAHVGVSINIGGPTVGWVPLAPREWYAPHYRHTPGYRDRVNPRPPGQRGPWQDKRAPQPVPTGPVMYGNQGVPGAVTVVPREVLVNRQHVGRGAIDAGQVQRGAAQQPLQNLPPPVRETPAPAQREAQTPWQRETRGPRAEPPPAGMPVAPMPEPERERGRAPRRGNETPPAATAPPAPAPTTAPSQGPVVDQRRDRPPPAAGPQVPREREARPPPGRPGTGPAPGLAPAPTAVPRPAPAPASPAPAAAPQRPAAGPAPAPAPAAAPAPQRAPPTSAPERAREHEAERERARDEERKRGPEGRGPQRERENQR